MFRIIIVALPVYVHTVFLVFPYLSQSYAMLNTGFAGPSCYLYYRENYLKSCMFKYNDVDLQNPAAALVSLQ
jgi:hypothetical protein